MQPLKKNKKRNNNTIIFVLQLKLFDRVLNLIYTGHFKPEYTGHIHQNLHNSSEYTLKRYDKHNSTLIALNSDYAKSVKIDEDDEVIILGVVDALIRDKRMKK